MKVRTFIGMMVMLTALVGMTAYGNEINLMDNSDVNEVYDFSKAIGITWKLHGFGTVGEDEVQKAKPEKGEEWWKEEQYTILFNEDGTLKGQTFSNEIVGEYSIDGNSLVIGDLWATEIGEEYDGDKYYKALYSPLTHIFEIKNDQLLLYYNEGQNYLLFDNVSYRETLNEYIDPQTNVIYTYDPGQASASVKAGHEEYIEGGHDGHEWETVYYSGCPDAAGDVTILDRFTVGTEEYVVTSIGERAFWRNKSIKSVSIPETVTDIGEEAFRSCESLTTVQLPEGLTKIAPYLFCGCSQLVSVKIPSVVSSIGNNAFYGCSSLSDLTLPGSLIHVDNNAFYGCSSLSDLTLPASLIYAGAYAFDRTPWYSKQYDEAPEGPFYIGQLLFGYKGAKPAGELVIREGTTCVCYGAFSDCNGLTSVTFPKSIAYVVSEAFYGCTNLTAVHITDLAAWCGIEFQGGNHVINPNPSSNPLFYANHLYLNGEEVTDLVIPEGVTRIGNYAFDQCTTLTSVTIPDGITSIGTGAFRNCENLTSVTISPSVETIGDNAFIYCFNLNAVHISDLAAWCGISFRGAANPFIYGARLYVGGEEVTDLVIPEGVAGIGDDAFRGSHLTSVMIPDGVTSIGEGAFSYCSDLSEVNIPASVKSIGYMAFFECESLANIISWIEEPFEIGNEVFERWEFDSKTYASATLHVPKGCKARYEATNGWKQFQNIVEMEGRTSYRPFVEDGKVWKVGSAAGISDGIAKKVDYYYFDGDTIIDGKTCKRMMCQRYINPDFSEYDYWSQLPSLTKVGAWYEEDKKVYFYDEGKQSMVLKYDFSIGDYETLQLIDDYPPFMIGPRQTGGIEGFKGVYRDVIDIMVNQNIRSTMWLEGVGGIDGPTRNAYADAADRMPEFLMSCSVGDEVIYLNDEYEDGATPEEARKKRFDFTHTIKIQPKSRIRSGEEQSLYGEYNDQQLGIHLDPLDDAYLVSITDESGKTVYEKAVNAGSIVGLSIDISAYAKGSYTVTVENSQESFTGVFETQTGIDVNGDGKVNGTDIQAVINVIVNEEYVEAADVNKDNKVNGTDIQEIINIIVNE